MGNGKNKYLSTFIKLSSKMNYFFPIGKASFVKWKRYWVYMGSSDLILKTQKLKFTEI